MGGHVADEGDPVGVRNVLELHTVNGFVGAVVDIRRVWTQRPLTGIRDSYKPKKYTPLKNCSCKAIDSKFNYINVI